MFTNCINLVLSFFFRHSNPTINIMIEIDIANEITKNIDIESVGVVGSEIK